MKYLTCSPGRKLERNSDKNQNQNQNQNQNPCRFYVCHKEDGSVVNCMKFKTIMDYRTWMRTQDKIGKVENLYFETFCDCDPHLDTLRLMSCYKRVVSCEDGEDGEDRVDKTN
jgi:hypothetical protein